MRMMMHQAPPRHDTLPGMARLAQVVAAAPSDLLLQPGTAPAKELHRAMRDIVVVARQIDPVHVERLIVTLRTAWRQLPEVRVIRDEALRDALWEHLLRICIEEFYEHHPAS
jgi:hypothetical protein